MKTVNLSCGRIHIVRTNCYEYKSRLALQISSVTKGYLLCSQRLPCGLQQPSLGDDLRDGEKGSVSVGVKAGRSVKTITITPIEP
jgi:hypothetical protein